MHEKIPGFGLMALELTGLFLCDFLCLFVATTSDV